MGGSSEQRLLDDEALAREHQTAGEQGSEALGLQVNDEESASLGYSRESEWFPTS